MADYSSQISNESGSAAMVREGRGTSHAQDDASISGERSLESKALSHGARQANLTGPAITYVSALAVLIAVLTMSQCHAHNLSESLLALTQQLVTITANHAREAEARAREAEAKLYAKQTDAPREEPTAGKRASKPQDGVRDD